MNNTSTLLWEEKSSIGQSMKFENKVIFDQSDIIKNIETKSNENVCDDIGTQKKLIRMCPKCGEKIIYNTRLGYKYAIKHNLFCKKCRKSINNGARCNHIGERFGNIIITNQYFNKFDRNLKVDLICDCGIIETNKSFRNVRLRRKCLHLPKQGSALRSLKFNYMRGAEKRDLEFKLTDDQFSKITKQNCIYCGAAPNSIVRSNYNDGSTISDIYVYNGIDRVDNELGYTNENCVPCCKMCNWFKAQSSVKDFINHVNKIYEYQKSKQLSIMIFNIHYTEIIYSPNLKEWRIIGG